MSDSLPLLSTAAAALDGLDVLAETAATLLTIPEPEPEPPSLPQQSLLVRQIRDVYWQIGEDYLRENPDAKEMLVYFHHWHESQKWEFKVVRGHFEDGGEFFEHQTWLNDNRV